VISRRDVAEHEAAHGVVGLALGLKLVEIRITPGDIFEGHCLWSGGERFALACMFGAGVVWDRMCKRGFSALDAELCRKHTTTNAATATCYRVAKLIISERRPALRLLTNALDARSHLTGKDVRQLALGLEIE
jgi:hypothetical protein